MVYTTAESGGRPDRCHAYGLNRRHSRRPRVPVPVPGAALPSTDPDFDGDSEEVNVNQRRDFAVVDWLLNHL